MTATDGHLTLSLPDDLPGLKRFQWYQDFPSCRLRGDSHLSIANPVIRVQAFVSQTQNSRVLSGNLAGDGPEPPSPVIIKFADKQSLLQEAAFYREAHELQGRLIPRFYGMFTAWCKWNKEDRPCIILENCGDAVRTPFAELVYNEK